MKTVHLVLPMFLVNSFSFQEGGKEIFVSFNTTLGSCIRYFSIPWVGWGNPLSSTTTVIFSVRQESIHEKFNSQAATVSGRKRREEKEELKIQPEIRVLIRRTILRTKQTKSRKIL